MSGSYIDGEDLDRYVPKPISTKKAIMISEEQYESLRAENERLREALKTIKTYYWVNKDVADFINKTLSQEALG